MTTPEKIELPILTPDEKWMDKMEGVEKAPEKIKRLIYLPAIANKTAVYAHAKKLSKYQKEMLLLSFRTEADNAIGVIHTHVSLSAGNSPSDRIGYLKDFENWQKRLLAFLQEALNCISEETWLEKFTILATDNKTLLNEDSREWWKRFKEIALLKVKGKVFDEVLYWNKFTEFTREALKLIQLGSAMMEITMERPEWMFQAMKNTGYLPANQKYKKTPVINNELQEKIEEVVSGELKRPVAELKTILKKVKKEASKTKPTSDNAETKKNKDLINNRPVTLDIFMGEYCDSKGCDIQSKRLVIYKAAEKELRLPKLAKKWRNGQSKVFYVPDLLKQWPEYCKIIPTLPPLK